MVGFSTVNDPAIMLISIITVADMMLYDLNLRKGMLKMIDRPMQCNTPNSIGLSGIVISVMEVRTMPRVNIHDPLINRRFVRSFDAFLLLVLIAKHIPTNKKNIGGNNTLD